MAPVMVCKSCGYEHSHDMRFCPNCGVKQEPKDDAIPYVDAAVNSARIKPKTRGKKKKHGKPPRQETVAKSERQVGFTQDVKSKPQVPKAATGDEASSIYKRLLAAVRGANRDNEEALTNFKQDCKLYGQHELSARVFYQRLLKYFGSEMMLEHMIPQLVRLIQDDKLRKKLFKAHLKVQNKRRLVSHGSDSRLLHIDSSPRSIRSAESFDDGSRIPSSPQPLRRPLSSSDLSGSTVSEHQGASRFTLNRYADDPRCSICSAVFELSRRRHRCRKCGESVCHSCSPARMLIPPDMVQLDTKGYDPAIPQRVCTLCAPLLECLQEALNAQYANCHKENPHETKARLHLPYSQSLEKECRNAADIIGNFFRGKYGADSDRQIPVSFLKRAHGLAFLTVIKAGLLISARVGTGIVIAKLPNGTWSAPSAIGTAGISGGLEAGGEIVEFMIILGSENAVKVFHRTQVNVGGGLSIAVGPFGRAAESQAAGSKGGINANYSYSHSRGLFVGISLHGAVITCRSEMNRNFYGKELLPGEILLGQIPQPRAAQCLYDEIRHAMEGVAEFQAEEDRKKQAKNICISCMCRNFVPKSFSKKCKSCGHRHDQG